MMKTVDICIAQREHVEGGNMLQANIEYHF